MTKRFNIILYPEIKFQNKLRVEMESLSKETGSIISLRLKPHITIFGDFKIEEENISGFISDLKLLVNKSIKTKAISFSTKPWKVLFLNVEITPKLRETHERSVELVQKFRTEWIDEQLLENKNFSSKQMKYVKKYAYHFAYEFFAPHFTLVGNDMSEESFEDIKKRYELIKPRDEILLDRLVITDQEDNSEFLVLDLK